MCNKKYLLKNRLIFLTHEIIKKFDVAYYISELFDQLLDNPTTINKEWATKNVYPLYKKEIRKIQKITDHCLIIDILPVKYYTIY